MFKLNSNSQAKEINQLALPLLINSITYLLIGLIDQAMVGRISIYAYSAVGVVTTTMYSITGIMGMLCIAFNILGAKKYGENDKEGFVNLFNVCFLNSFLIGVFGYIVLFIFKTQILSVIFGLTGEVLNEAVKFFSIYSLTLGLNMMLFIFSAYYKIINKTKMIFWGSLIAGVIAISLDYILIFGKFGMPRLGVTGAAISAVLALFGNLCYYLITIRKSKIIRFQVNDLFEHLKRIYTLGIPLIEQEFLEGTLFIIAINAIVARIGILELSVFTLVFGITNILLMPMYAYSSAALNLVSQNFKNEKDILRVPKISLYRSLQFYAALLIISIIFKNYLPCLFTNEEELIFSSAIIIPLALYIQVFNFPHSIYKYTLQGIGEEKWVLKISAIINTISIVIIGLFVFVFNKGLIGVYLGIGFNYLVLSICFIKRYRGIVSKKIGEIQNEG